MILDRKEVADAISFIKHVIPESDETGKNCLFVRFEKDKAIFTGGGEFTAKRVILVRPISTEEAAKEQSRPVTGQSFMIPKGTLISFETLLSKHKSKCKKLAKNDQSYLYIDLDEVELESFGVSLHYKQPSFQFKDFEPLFQHKMESTSSVHVSYADIDDVMKGFQKSKQVKITMAGEKGPMLFYQESNGYEAILIPSDPEEQPEDE